MQKILKSAMVGMFSAVVSFGAMAGNMDNASLNEELKKMNLTETAATTEENADTAEKTKELKEEVKAEEEKLEEAKQEVKEEVKEETKEVEPKVAEVREPETPIKPEAKFPHGMQLGVGISGTTGLNGWVGYNNKKFDSFWWKRLGVRVDFATMSPLKSLVKKATDKYVGEEGVEFEDFNITNFNLKSHHVAALIDIYPFGDTWFLGGLRVTGGYFFGKTELTADIIGKIDGAPGEELQFELDGVEYKYTGNDVKGKAKIAWDFKGPYAGAGFDLGITSGFKLFFDAGVVFTNKAAELGLDLNPDNLQVKDGDSWYAVSGSYLTKFNEHKASVLKDANDEFEDFKFYPVVKFGFMYRF